MKVICGENKILRVEVPIVQCHPLCIFHGINIFWDPHEMFNIPLHKKALSGGCPMFWSCDLATAVESLVTYISCRCQSRINQNEVTNFVCCNCRLSQVMINYAVPMIMKVRVLSGLCAILVWWQKSINNFAGNLKCCVIITLSEIWLSCLPPSHGSTLKNHPKSKEACIDFTFSSLHR